MAINVDLVYKTVLLILNQQQRGYITPDEFNKVSTQVQLGIFERYMSDLNQQLRIPENDSEYGNRVKNIQEKIDIFKRIGTAAYAAPYFLLETAAVPPSVDNVPFPDFYRLGSVIYNDYIEAQMIERNEWYLIKKSPLIAPTVAQPVFLYEDNKIHLQPESITTKVQVSYIKKPVDVQWGYSVVQPLGQFIYNPATSINFELHVSEQVSVITGILLYSGVIIQDPTIIQVASQQVQQEENNEKS